MMEISVVDEKPQMVAGMRRRGHYKEIAKMLPALFEYIREAYLNDPREVAPEEILSIIYAPISRIIYPNGANPF